MFFVLPNGTLLNTFFPLEATVNPSIFQIKTHIPHTQKMFAEINQILLENFYSKEKKWPFALQSP